MDCLSCRGLQNVSIRDILLLSFDNVNLMMSIQKFGVKLRVLRLARNITLKQMALALGLKTHGYLSEIESGKKKPTLDLALRVARFFEISTDSLLKDEIDLEMK